MSTAQDPVLKDLGVPPRPRVLLVDDHDLGRKALARLLDAMGFDVTVAENGQTAFETLRSAPPFHYVLTDVRLPDHDGREIARAASQLDPAPRIALITGWDVAPEETTELGVEWVFLKPLNVHEIVTKLNQSPPESLRPAD